MNMKIFQRKAYFSLVITPELLLINLKKLQKYTMYHSAGNNIRYVE